MTHTDLLAAIHASLDEEPADWQARRELADLLEDAGDLTGAACQRWMVAEGKHPYRGPVGREWWWPGCHSNCEGANRLPERVWVELPDWSERGCRRWLEAALAVALTRAGLIGQ